jgi:2-iminoacetate synthase ThiH
MKPEKKTKEEIERLKHNWLCDACWDIEDTEGFEAHVEELREFRIAHNEKIENEYRAKIPQRAIKLGIPDRFDLVKYLEELEHQIQKLAEKIERIEAKL